MANQNLYCHNFFYRANYITSQGLLLYMDCALISTVYKCRVTSRVHKKFFKIFYNQRVLKFSVWVRTTVLYMAFFKFLKSGPLPTLERLKTPPKDPNFETLSNSARMLKFWLWVETTVL